MHFFTFHQWLIMGASVGLSAVVMWGVTSLADSFANWRQRCWEAKRDKAFDELAEQNRKWDEEERAENAFIPEIGNICHSR
jgi:hypothetical protein